IQLIIYIFYYDKSYYHIDTVREPMIRFLFFQSMLLGAYFRIKKDIFINKNKLNNWFLLIIMLFIYFVSKLIFVNFDSLSAFQISNQIVLMIALYFMFRCFAGIDVYLESLPA